MNNYISTFSLYQDHAGLFKSFKLFTLLLLVMQYSFKIEANVDGPKVKLDYIQLSQALTNTL